MLRMNSWKEIMDSDEAKAIRESAETAFKRRRRDKGVKNRSQQVDPPVTKLTTPSQRARIDHIQRETSPPAIYLAQRSDIRVLMAFIDVIFPVKFVAPSFSGITDRSWLYRSLIDVGPLYESSGNAGQLPKQAINQKETLDLEADPDSLQISALRGLQLRVAELGAERYSGKELFRRGMQTLAIMTQLVSLEVFSYVDGQWEMHLEAARTISGMFQSKWAPNLFTDKMIEQGSLATTEEEDLMERSTIEESNALKFFITSFVWVDIIANATYGPPPFNPKHFDYLPLLENGSFRPQSMIGCQSCIMTLITEITTIEAWRNDQLEQGCLSVIELANRATALSDRLKCGIQRIESVLSEDPTNIEADSGAVNLVFSYAGLVYLHTIVSGVSPHTPEIKHNATRCLEKLEVLPAHLLVRICWPYTIAGCMATEDLHERFRGVLTRAADAGHALGTTWKGLRIMEECWRLRRFQEGMWCWRSTMKRMKIKDLLI